MFSTRVLIVLCLVYVFLQIDCRPPTATSSGSEPDENSTALNATGKHKAIMGRFIAAPCKEGYTKVGNTCRKVQGG